MSDFKALKIKSEQKIRAAEHFLSVTYPIVKEPKLLMLIIENLFESFDFMIAALLDYDKIKLKENTFEEKFTMFRRKVVPKNDINKETVEFIEKIRKIVEEHKKTNVEFTKKEKFVITDDKYNLTTVTEKDAKEYIKKTKIHLNILMKSFK